MGQKLLFFAALSGTLLSQCVANLLPIKLELRSELSSRLTNIHVVYSEYVSGHITFTYGTCMTESWDDSHHVLAETDTDTPIRDSRLMWTIPPDAPPIVCVSAWDENGALVGRSEPQKLHYMQKQGDRKRSTESIKMTEANGFDPLGSWFDGVQFLLQKEPSIIDVEAVKRKPIAIVGAGMSGLMTYLVLHQAGFTNITILEASHRLGGRVYTAYLSGGSSDYSYQEMGPMRFPVDYTDPDSGDTYNISDTQLVFSLVDEMNKINKDNSRRDLHVNFIPWYDQSKNGLRYYRGFRLPNGLPPTKRQIEDDPSLQPSDPDDKNTKAVNDQLLDDLPGDKFMVTMAKNMYKAHKQWISDGLGGQPGDRWSEFAYISQYLKGSLNSTDVIVGPQNADASFWLYLYDSLYENADSWKTVDGGLSRIPQSFLPLVEKNVRFNTNVERVKHSNNKVTLQWKHDYKDSTFQSATFDYAIVAVPFTVVRQWRLPKMDMVMTNAINNLVYDTCCKVALEYSERFWEKYENPIYGSCSTSTDIPGINVVCYPSYNINGTGPATILGTYLEGSVNHETLKITTMSDEEHVQYVLDAMTEIHGEETRKLYTGKSRRKCWALDPFTAGSWANPTIGQHELYIPEYFKVHKNMIFVGEHTANTHGWISSALESGVRGGVQMLLELGLVDEAKAAVEKWISGNVKA